MAQNHAEESRDREFYQAARALADLVTQAQESRRFPSESLLAAAQRVRTAAAQLESPTRLSKAEKDLQQAREDNKTLSGHLSEIQAAADLTGCPGGTKFADWIQMLASQRDEARTQATLNQDRAEKAEERMQRAEAAVARMLCGQVSRAAAIVDADILADAVKESGKLIERLQTELQQQRAIFDRMQAEAEQARKDEKVVSGILDDIAVASRETGKPDGMLHKDWIRTLASRANSCWLIEHPRQSKWIGRNPCGKMHWVAAGEAIRFSRKEDAEAMRAALGRVGLFSDPSTWNVTEHGFYDSATAPTPYIPTTSAPARKHATTAEDLVEIAWGVIANAGVVLGDWKSMTKDWQDAAARWRDDYHAWLKNRTAPPPINVGGGGCFVGVGNHGLGIDFFYGTKVAGTPAPADEIAKLRSEVSRLRAALLDATPPITMVLDSRYIAMVHRPGGWNRESDEWFVFERIGNSSWCAMRWRNAPGVNTPGVLFQREFVCEPEDHTQAVPNPVVNKEDGEALAMSNATPTWCADDDRKKQIDAWERAATAWSIDASNEPIEPDPDDVGTPYEGFVVQRHEIERIVSIARGDA